MKENGRRKFLLAVATMLVVSVTFEFAEFVTDSLFGWGNFYPGVDTLGDVIFDVAGIVTAAVVISRHRVSVLRRPFWHDSWLTVWMSSFSTKSRWSTSSSWTPSCRPSRRAAA